MEKVNEFEKEYRNGKSGVKYLFRGPNIDWGVIRFLPGEGLGRHRHEKVEETFYFRGDGGKILVNDSQYQIKAGDAFRIEPGDVHDILNDTTHPMDLVFIKHIYAPDDKIKVD